MTTLTNYTTYDLDYYYTDLKRIPRQTSEERHHLIASLAVAQAQPLPLTQVTATKQHLIEGYLRFATRVVIDHCPRTRYDLLPDLLQEASLGLIQATDRFDFSSGGNFTAYACAWMVARVKRTIVSDTSVKTNDYAHARARQQGILEQFYALTHMASLDEAMQWFETDEVEEPIAHPIYPTETAPERDPKKRAQVDTLLSYLSPRAQTIMRMRHGLLDDDERSHTESEIARDLGISRGMVHTTEHDAMQRLRALVAGEATIIKRNGKLCISLPNRRIPRLSPERQAMLLQTSRRLAAEGRSLTARLLADETHLPKSVAAVFLRQQRGEAPTSAQAERQARLERMEEAYTRIEAAGKKPSGHALASEANVAKMTALKFLRTRRQQTVTGDASLRESGEGAK